MSRRRFLLTACAAATTLVAIEGCSQDSHKAKGTRPGGSYRVPTEATTEPDVATTVLGGDEFVFDVQGHFLDYSVDPLAIEEFDEIISRSFKQMACGEHEPRDCFSIEHFLEEMFLRSDTNMAILSGIPVPLEHDPMSPAALAEARRLGGAVCHDDRVLLHGKVAPTAASLDDVLAGMETLAGTMPLVGWKTYTHKVGPGWWLDDHEADAPAVGASVIRKAAELGVPRIAVHKGLVPSRYNTPEDVGPAAQAHPDVNFLVYHSGYVLGREEGPYTDETADVGINALLTSLRRAGIGPNQNVYVDLGTTWWHLMSDPNQAAHAWGKLLRDVGEDNVLWGTDSIWYGPPQDQIQAFRALQISEELQERFGYPALTDEVKRKVLGVNGARAYGITTPVTTRCEFTPEELRALRAGS
jgi:predicted TIM-barrel fold metal-dependent hydrolase